jgi:hypothetical protein
LGGAELVGELGGVLQDDFELHLWGQELPHLWVHLAGADQTATAAAVAAVAGFDRGAPAAAVAVRLSTVLHVAVRHLATLQRRGRLTGLGPLGSLITKTATATATAAA